MSSKLRTSAQRGREVDQEDVPPAESSARFRRGARCRALGMSRVGRRVEVPVVQRDRQGAVAERRRPIDELAGGVSDAIGRVVVCMRVELDLDHSR